MPPPEPGVETLLAEAVGLPDPVERAAFLDRACTDPIVRAEVARLADLHFRAGSFLGRPAGADPEATAAYSPPAPPAGGRVGPYKLLEVIGEGGMGVVWMAEQTEPVRRRVAVKLVRPGLDSAQVLARFEHERQALALMDHPNIARVLDAGATPDDRPYFVMELVHGPPITQYCDDRRLGVADRLRLFADVCRAVQHAHQKGVIHRDLKPSNVLVARYDETPVAKVIDFGVAKAAGRPLTDKTLFTGFGGVVGTPEYMSPEQAAPNQLDVDTRSDVYALGVLLYELLTGTTPLTRARTRQAGMLEVLRLVREEEPPTPSSRLSTADGQASVAACRGTEPRRLAGLVRGELDWVTMRALEKDRDRRYDTAAALARDVERYLAGEVVEARRPGAGYRLRKFARRHKGPMLAAGLVLVALLLGIAGTTLGLVRAERATRAEAERADGERRAKEAAEAEKQRAVAFRDRALDALRATVGEDVQQLIGEKQQLTANERAYLEAVARRWQAFAAGEEADEQSRAVRAEGYNRMAFLYHMLGRWDDARTGWEQSAALREGLAAEFPAVPKYRRDLAVTYYSLGGVLDSLRRPAEAERINRQAVAVLDRLAAESPAEPDYRRELAISLSNLGVALYNQRRPAEAEAMSRRALAELDRLADESPGEPEYRLQAAHIRLVMGNLLATLGRPAEAEGECRRALAELGRLAAGARAGAKCRQQAARCHYRLGVMLSDLGRRAEAEVELREGLAGFDQLAADFPAVPEYRSSSASVRIFLGDLLDRLGRRAEAEAEYRRALAVLDKLVSDLPTVPAYRADLAVACTDLAVLLFHLGRRAEAEEPLRRGLSVLDRLTAEFPAEVPTASYRRSLAQVQLNMGILLRDLGREAEAETQLRRGAARWEQLAADEPTVPGHRLGSAWCHFNLGLLLARPDRRADAEAEFRIGVVRWETLAADEPGVPEHRMNLARCHYRLMTVFVDLGRRAEGVAEHGRELAVLEKLAADFPAVPGYRMELGCSYFKHAELMDGGGNPADSLAWFGRAIDTLRPVHEADPRDSDAKQNLRDSHARRAIVYGRLKKYAEAGADWDRAVALSPPEEQPRDRMWRAVSRMNAGRVAEAVAEAAELRTRPGWRAGDLYNFACVYSVAASKTADKRQEYADAAVQLLREAVKAGWTNAAHMKNDSDLAPLRDRDDFKQLVADLEAKSRPKREVAPAPRPAG